MFFCCFCGSNPVFKIKNARKTSGNQSRLLKGIFAEKIPNFFTGAFIGNHWKISKKQPKKRCQKAQK
jgi:hypothetical protein